MANVYRNYKAKLSTNALTTIYTVPAETTTIVKSIRVSNEDTENNCNVSLFLVDTSSVSYSLEIDRPIEAKVNIINISANLGILVTTPP